MLERDHAAEFERARGRSPTWAHEALAHVDALHHLARYLTGNPADAEDLVRETYARAFQGADGFAAGTHLKAWLYRILRNTFVSEWRERQRESVGADEPEDPPAAEKRLFGDAELERLRGVVAGEIEAALMTLAEDGRIVILLHHEGLSEAEMAFALGCATGTVKSRLSRSRATLRQRLAEHRGGRL
jgi:RNA polymerase sigma-70 factor, ECF subfamily